MTVICGRLETNIAIQIASSSSDSSMGYCSGVTTDDLCMSPSVDDMSKGYIRITSVHMYSELLNKLLSL